MPQWPTLPAITAQESAWQPMVRSPVGAQGMAQFMPATATWISQLYPQLRENKPYNPTWAIRALVQYDQHLWKNSLRKMTVSVWRLP